MAESDFLSYSSIYETFSKGPKSIYYGIGDEMLPGAILNVPQNDDDDEWGRTQRISEERTYDFIAKIYKTLFDPFNSLADISLTPGEAGSEINVAKNIIRLVGRAGIDVGVFDLSVPSVTLGDVVINGADNAILMGSGFEATETTLKLNTFYEFEGTATEGTLTFKNVKATLKEDGLDISFEINVNGNPYLYTQDSGSPLLLLPMGGILQVRGTTKTNGVLPNAPLAYDIGSTSLKFNNVYSQNITAENTNSSYTYSTFIFPPTDGSDLRIGHASNNDIVNIRAGSFYVYNVSDTVPTIGILEDSGTNYLNIGDTTGSYSVNIRAHDSDGFKVFTPNDPVNPVFSLNSSYIWMNRTIFPGLNVDIGDGVTSIRNLYASTIYGGAGYFSGTLTTRHILPAVSDTYNIGSNSVVYRDIYTCGLNSRTGIFSDSANVWYLCGPNMLIKVYGDTKIGVCSTYVELYDPLFTKSIYPSVPIGNFIGSLSNGGYEAIYLRDQTTGLPVRVYINSGVLYP